ncbi:unnamed protein product [Oppiella nova]|uniref:Alanine--tRNA ligase n=1 Tax=Oppiella nova TaxID=334625 RepID=A0A7R9QQ84_9ACAR|nr:unnamed protein product [Oppiella nova]CAG2170341.1 unnamed protein product [Oppiella nova]
MFLPIKKYEIITELLLVKNQLGQVENIMILKMLVILQDITHFLKCWKLGISAEKLYVTIYHNDDESAIYWQKIANLSDERIIRIKTNDNFWSMGDIGPCGPCSEIFYDHGDHIKGGLPGTKDADGDRFIEIWNMVFMQFEQLGPNNRITLPKKSIDTGMGLEQDLMKVKAEGEAKFSYRVIADHLRASAFLIADGIIPSNEGRGYVLRRIMRRIDLMGDTYPELKRAENCISNILKQEELRFKVTLERGLKLLDAETINLSKGKQLSGEVAFKLYDTYGFPLDLIEDILKNKQIAVNVNDFNIKMQEQRERAKKSWFGSSESKADKIWFDIKSKVGSTEFLGYTLNEVDGRVLVLVKDNIFVDEIVTVDEQFILISNQTPFYGESGGQMGDIGNIQSINSKIKVINTIKYLGSIIAHICLLEEGKIEVGDNAHFKIDIKYRNNLKIHHSATHILHSVLHEVLGKHVIQKGSLVAHDHLRFDISYHTSLSKTEIILIEDKVNQIITNNYQVDITLMFADEAIEIGAIALFGEKYDNEVRVVSMGESINGKSYSLELCGGTHVNRTGDIGSFKIISENAIAVGVRRIEAVSSLTISKKELEKELMKLQIALLNLDIDQLEHKSTDILGIKLIYKVVQNLDNKVLRLAAEQLANKINNLVILYVNNSSNKLSITIAVSRDINNILNAGSLAKELSIFLGGTGGGGQNTIAQAGALFVLSACNMTKRSHPPCHEEAVIPVEECSLAADFERNVGDRVFFGYNKYDLSHDSKTLLCKQAAWLKAHPHVRATIEGHCDKRGTREYNLALGSRRANAVYEFLIHQGISANRLDTISYGKERPAVEGDNEMAYKQNRRAVTVNQSQ